MAENHTLRDELDQKMRISRVSYYYYAITLRCTHLMMMCIWMMVQAQALR